MSGNLQELAAAVKNSPSISSNTTKSSGSNTSASSTGSTPSIRRRVRNNELRMEQLDQQSGNVHRISVETRYINRTFGKERLFARYWKPPADVNMKGLIFMSHGYYTHTGCFDELAKVLAADGFVVFGHDHIRFGMSEGSPRATVLDFEEAMNDIFVHVTKIKQLHQGMPAYFLGEGIGATMGVKLAADDPFIFKGLVFLSPLLEVHDEFKHSFIRYLISNTAYYIWPQFQLDQPPLDLIFSNLNYQKNIVSDPVAYKGGITAATIAVMTDAIDKIYKKIAQLKTPFLAMHGTHDIFSNCHGSTVLMESSGAMVQDEKHLALFEGANHHLLGDRPEIREAVIDYTRRFFHHRAANIEIPDDPEGGCSRRENLRYLNDIEPSTFEPSKMRYITKPGHYSIPNVAGVGGGLGGFGGASYARR